MPFLTIHHSFRKHRSTTSARCHLPPNWQQFSTNLAPHPSAQWQWRSTCRNPLTLLTIQSSSQQSVIQPFIEISSDGSHVTCKGAMPLAGTTRPHRPAMLCGLASPKDLSYLHPFSISLYQTTPITYNSIPHMRMMYYGGLKFVPLRLKRSVILQ